MSVLCMRVYLYVYSSMGHHVHVHVHVHEHVHVHVHVNGFVCDTSVYVTLCMCMRQPVCVFVCSGVRARVCVRFFMSVTKHVLICYSFRM